MSPKRRAPAPCTKAEGDRICYWVLGLLDRVRADHWGEPSPRTPPP